MGPGAVDRSSSREHEDGLSTRRPLVIWDTSSCPPPRECDFGSILRILQTSFSLSNRARVVAFGSWGYDGPESLDQGEDHETQPILTNPQRQKSCQEALQVKQRFFWVVSHSGDQSPAVRVQEGPHTAACLVLPVWDGKTVPDPHTWMAHRPLPN